MTLLIWVIGTWAVCTVLAFTVAAIATRNATAQAPEASRHDIRDGEI